MAKYIDKKEENEFTAKEGLTYLKHKYMSIFPWHIVAFIITYIIYIITKELTIKGSIKILIKSIPAIFLVQMTGLNFGSPNHIEWYLSSMLIAIAIIYPFCKKNYDLFTKYVTPIGSLLLLGCMIYTTKSLTGVMAWKLICYKRTIRAIIEISLGTTAYEISKWLSNKKINNKGKIILTITEFLCFALSIAYIMTTLSKIYEIYILILLFIMISIIFSNQTYGLKYFNNKFCLFLGKISLPIYL